MRRFLFIPLFFFSICCHGQELEFRAPDHESTDELYQAAIDAFLAGNNEQAKKAFMKAARSSENAASGNNNLALIALAEGNYPKAENLLERSASGDTSLYNLALVEGLRGEFAKAKSHLLQSPENISANRAMNLGIFAARSGDFETAEEAFESALKQDPENDQLKISQALILEEAGRSDAALDLLKPLLGQSNSRVDADLLAGKIYAAKGELEKSERHYSSALGKDGKSELAMSGLANSLFSQGQHEEAQKLYKKLVKRFPDKMAYALHMADSKAAQGDYNKAVELYHKASSDHPNQPSIYNHVGQVLMKMGSFEEAVDAHKIAARMDKQNEEYTHDLGMAHYFNKDFEDALVYLEQSVRSDPAKQNDYETQVALGFSNCHLGDYNKAILHFEEATLLDEDEDAYSGLGLAYHFSGDFDSALANYKKALAINPNNDQTYVNMGNLFQKAGSFEKAKDAYKSALKRNPSAYLAYNGLGNTLRAMEELELSIDAYQSAIDLAPTEGFLHNNLAVSYYYLANVKDRFGHPGEAQELYQLSIDAIDEGRQLDSAFGIHFLNNRGVVKKDMGDYEGARRDFAVKDNKATANNDGIVYALEGDLEKAYDAFTRAIEHDPYYPEAYFNRAAVATEMGRADQALKDKQLLQALDFNPRQNPYQKDQYFSTVWYLTFEEFIPEADIEPDFEMAYEAPEVEGIAYDFVLMASRGVVVSEPEEESEVPPTETPAPDVSTTTTTTHSPIETPNTISDEPVQPEEPSDPIAPVSETPKAPVGKGGNPTREPTKKINSPASPETPGTEMTKTPSKKAVPARRSARSTSSKATSKRRRKGHSVRKRPKRVRVPSRKRNASDCPTFK